MKLFGSSEETSFENVQGNINFGNVAGDLIQNYITGTPQAEPTLPWREATANSGAFVLLQWRTRLTEMVGRDAVLKDLLDWAKAGPGIRARFLCGPGGVGKTRVAAEAAQALRDEGWCAGFASFEKKAPYPLVKGGTFLIVDYPEENRAGVNGLLTRMAEAEANGDCALCLLFVTRHGPDWWQSQIDEARAGALFDKGPVMLDPIEEEKDSYAIFQAAQKAVPRTEGSAEPHPVTEGEFKAWLGATPLNRRPLFILAGALHSVLHPETNVVSIASSKVVLGLASWETSRLDREATKHGFGPSALTRLAAMAAIRNGLDANNLRRLAVLGLELGLGETDSLIDRLERAGRLEDETFPAPAPDIVAAALLSETFGKRSSMASEWLWAALDGDVTNGIERLGRLSYDAEIELRMSRFDVGSALADMVRGHVDRCRACQAIAAQYNLPVGLTAMAIEVSRTLADDAQERTQQAGHLNNLSLRLSDAGELKAALEAGQESLAVYRNLAKNHPERFNPDLAMSLNNLSIRLSDAGEQEAALDAVQEGLRLIQPYAEKYPDGPFGQRREALLKTLAMLEGAGEG